MVGWKRGFVILCLVGLPLSVAVAEDQEKPHGKGHDATMRHDFKDAEAWAARFETPERLVWQRPQTVMRLLALIEGERVADLGAGTGFFTRMLGWAVGETGKVYAVDIEQEMLDYIVARDDLSPFDNIVPILAAPDDPKLPEGELDVILVVNTWHHIDDRLSYLEHLHGALNRYGRLVIIDWHEGDLPVGPPAGHKLDRQAVVDELEEAGWRLVSESPALPYQYILFFYPPQDEAGADS